MIKHPLVYIQRMTVELVVEKHSGYSKDSELPSSGLVEFYESEKSALEEFSFIHKIFTPACKAHGQGTC